MAHFPYSVSATVVVLFLRSGDSQPTTRGGAFPRRRLCDGVSGLDFSPTGELVATYRGSDVFLFSPGALEGREGTVTAYPASGVSKEWSHNATGDAGVDGSARSGVAMRYRGAQNERTFLKQVWMDA